MPPDNPFVKDISMVYPKPSPGGGYTIVILDRVEDGIEPEHCIHGKVTCYGPCGEWLWLGSESYGLVQSGQAVGVCQPCATLWFEQARAEGFEPEEHRVGNVNDHRRADGPHA